MHLLDAVLCPDIEIRRNRKGGRQKDHPFPSALGGDSGIGIQFPQHSDRACNRQHSQLSGPGSHSANHDNIMIVNRLLRIEEKQGNDCIHFSHEAGLFPGRRLHGRLLSRADRPSVHHFNCGGRNALRDDVIASCNHIQT